MVGVRFRAIYENVHFESFAKLEKADAVINGVRMAVESFYDTSILCVRIVFKCNLAKGLISGLFEHLFEGCKGIIC